MFFAFFNLFGSIVLLPIYLQTLMGYTSFLAGLALGPGGIATMIAMPIAGKLVTKINPKAILAFGIAVAGYSVHLMAQFNLQLISIPSSGQESCWESAWVFSSSLSQR